MFSANVFSKAGRSFILSESSSVYLLCVFVRCLADRIHLTERSYYALMHANQGFQCSKRGQIDIKVGAPDGQLHSALHHHFYCLWFSDPDWMTTTGDRLVSSCIFAFDTSTHFLEIHTPGRQK